MKKSVFRICILALIFSLFSIGIFTSCTEPEAVITEFAFLSSENPSLDFDYYGSINGKEITVRLPESIYSDSVVRSNLKAHIGTGYMNQIINSDSLDFNQSPVSIYVKAGELSNAEYYVVIKKINTDVKPGDLYISQAYLNDQYKFNTDNCLQFIEITNNTSEAIDLSGVMLNSKVWIFGVRSENEDKHVYLEGTLAPGKSFILYSNRAKTPVSTKNNFRTENNDFLYASDNYFNNILSTSGIVHFNITCNGVLLDEIAMANKYTEKLSAAHYKHFYRKPFPYDYGTWKPSEWYFVNEATLDKTKIENPSSILSTITIDSKDLNLLELQLSSSFYVPTIDSVTKQIKVFAQGKSHNFTVYASTNGDRVEYNSINEDGTSTFKEILSGETRINFLDYTNENPLKLSVKDVYGSPQDYTIDYVHIEGKKFKQIMNLSEIEDGDAILFYQKYEYNGNVYANVFANIFSGSSFASGEVNEENTMDANDGMQLFYMIENGSNYVFKTLTDTYLAISSTKGTATVNYAASVTDYAKWNVEPVAGKEGFFTIQNANTNSGYDKYLEKHVSSSGSKSFAFYVSGNTACTEDCNNELEIYKEIKE